MTGSASIQPIAGWRATVFDMGHVNVVSGHIREAHYFGGYHERRRLLREANRRTIAWRLKGAHRRGC